MDTSAERLRRARIASKYASASEAARAIGVPVPTYTSHENGSRGFGPAEASRYARMFGVPASYLLLLAGGGNQTRMSNGATLTHLPKGFADLPPQGYMHMTELQRFGHKVRCAVIEVLESGKVGTWNVSTALQHVIAEINKDSK